jgi:hypothetical protein
MLLFMAIKSLINHQYPLALCSYWRLGLVVVENGLTVSRFIVEHLAMMHGWLVDVHIRGFDLHLRPSI